MNHHKYIEKLETKYDVEIGHSWEPGDGSLGTYSKDDIKKYKKQTKEYGFDERETYAVWKSTASCLYERMKMFMEIAPGVVDYTTYEFDIPVLIKNSKKERKKTSRHFHKIYSHTKQLGAMKIMTKYLEKGLALTANPDTKEQGMEYLQTAFEIFSIIMPAVWW